MARERRLEHDRERDGHEGAARLGQEQQAEQGRRHEGGSGPRRRRAGRGGERERERQGHRGEQPLRIVVADRAFEHAPLEPGVRGGARGRPDEDLERLRAAARSDAGDHRPRTVGAGEARAREQRRRGDEQASAGHPGLVRETSPGDSRETGEQPEREQRRRGAREPAPTRSPNGAAKPTTHDERDPERRPRPRAVRALGACRKRSERDGPGSRRHSGPRKGRRPAWRHATSDRRAWCDGERTLPRRLRSRRRRSARSRAP